MDSLLWQYIQYKERIKEEIIEFLLQNQSPYAYYQIENYVKDCNLDDLDEEDWDYINEEIEKRGGIAYTE